MNKEYVLSTLRRYGKQQAEDLRTKAVAGTVTDTEIIDAEACIPDFDPATDYTNAAAGTPVRDNDQVYGLLQPHKPANYNIQHPGDFPALWGLKHTTNPEKAKPYVAPLGTSGLYSVGECCTDSAYENPAQVFISKVDNNAYAPHEYAANWTMYTG